MAKNTPKADFEIISPIAEQERKLQVQRFQAVRRAEASREELHGLMLRDAGERHLRPMGYVVPGAEEIHERIHAAQADVERIDRELVALRQGLQGDPLVRLTREARKLQDDIADGERRLAVLQQRLGGAEKTIAAAEEGFADDPERAATWVALTPEERSALIAECQRDVDTLTPQEEALRVGLGAQRTRLLEVEQEARPLREQLARAVEEAERRIIELEGSLEACEHYDRDGIAGTIDLDNMSPSYVLQCRREAEEAPVKLRLLQRQMALARLALLDALDAQSMAAGATDIRPELKRLTAEERALKERRRELQARAEREKFQRLASGPQRSKLQAQLAELERELTTVHPVVHDATGRF